MPNLVANEALPPEDRVGAVRRGWLLVVLLGTVHGFAFLDRMLIALLAPLIKATLRLDDFETGLLLGAFFVLSYAASSLLLRTLADRFNRIRLVIGSLLVSTVATVGCGVAPGFAALAVARMGLGIAQSVLSPAALSLIGQVLPQARQGRGVSIYTSGATLGRSLALILGGAVLAGLQALAGPRHGLLQDWRLVFLVFTLPNLILAVCLMRVVEPPRSASSERVTATPSALRDWFSRYRFFYVSHTLAASATVLVIQTVTAWATTLLARRFAMPVPVAGGTFGLIVLVAAPLGHLLGGTILDRLDARLGLRAPGVVMATALVASVPLIALVGLAKSYAVALAGLTVFSLIMGIASPAGFTAVQRSTPSAMRGRATAWFLVCVTSIGFGLGPPALGLLTDRLFGATGIGSALLLVVAAAATVGAVSVMLQWRSRTPLPSL